MILNRWLFRKYCFLLLVFVLAGAPAISQKAPKPTAAITAPVKVTTVEGITEYRLGNGLRVLLFPDPTKQTATVNITYLVGSRNENYGETGMAHLLEHLLFKGTPSHPDIPQELTSHGARPNGTTWFDRTNYFETFNATDENLNWALDLEADRMINSYIAKKDLESEFSVVRNEMEAGENDPTGVLMERMMSTAYLWHNYGKSTIGARSDVENVPIDRLQAFYRKYYQPDNAVLTVAGKFDPEKTLKLINQKFGTIPRPARTLPHEYTIEPIQDGERTVTLRRVGDVQMVGALYHIPPGSQADFPAIEVFQGLLTDEPSGRLYKRLVETRLATNTFGFDFSTKDPGASLFFATVLKDKNVDTVKEVLINTIEGFTTEAPTREDVERIKNKQLKDIELALNSSERVGLSLSEYIALGDWRLLFYNRDQLKKVTTGDVVRVAKKYFLPSNRTFGLFVPTSNPVRADVPNAPDLAALLKDYKGGEAIAQGEAFEATPANIQGRLVHFTAGGVTTNLLSKKTRGESVNAAINLRFGNETALQGKGTAAEFTASMLNKGTTSKTRQQLQDELDKLKAQVSISGGATGVNVTIQTTRPNLPEVLKVVDDMLEHPSFPADELEKLKQEQIAALEENRSEPSSMAIIELQRYLDPYPKGDPRHVQTVDESIADIKAVTLEDIKNFYKNFYGASNAYISVVGDFDPGEIKSLVTTQYAGWKSPQPFARLEAKPITAKPLNKNLEAPDEANAFFFAASSVPVTMKDADYPALVLGNYMLGGGFLNSRLATRIRQKEGISYGIGSNVSADYFDKNSGRFMVYAIYAPENAARLEAAFKEEIEKVIKKGFTEQEVADAKKGLLQSRKVSLAQDNVLAPTLNTYSYYGEPIAFWQKLDDAISKLTAQQVNDVMKKYIDLNKISIIKAGDFSKKQPEKKGF